MEATKPRINLRILGQKYLNFGLFIFYLCFAATLLNAQTIDEIADSSDPVLISTPDSTRTLAANADTWRGTLPRRNHEIFQPGARAVFFVTNLDLMPDEGANAFKVFAQDRDGKQYRLTVEAIQRLSRQDWIYALTVRLHDANGYNGQPSAKGDVLIRVSWRGNTSNRLRLGLGKIGGEIKGEVGAVPKPTFAAPTDKRNAANPGAQSDAGSGGDRKRFMEQAAFGPTQALDFKLKQRGIRRWIEDQFYTPYPTIPYPNFPLINGDANIGCGGIFGTNPEINLCHRNHYTNYNNSRWLIQEALYGDDQLRRRVSWALHQIWVASHASINIQRGTQEYIEILDRNAFGNYRDLMYEMTLSPAMGEFLDMVRSTRQNPNENYPRELLQLFTVGLYKLNQDGTLILDNQGNRIPTYDQDKVNQFTKIFTGWTHCNNGNNPACSNAVVGSLNYIDPMHLPFPNNHDQTAKSLFDYSGAPNPTIAACSNCTTDASRVVYANDSLNKTLDNIFYHPNVGPFVGKLLIQHFVTSDPSPAYVARVAAAFNNNGAGTRGDMKAVIKSVLLDPEARGSRKTDPTYGKLREPLQHVTNILRMFNVRAATNAVNVGLATPPASCQNRSDGVFDWLMRDLGQELWLPPTVFNYFSPDYVVPGTDILGPEFALANTGTSFVRNNIILNFTWGSGIWFAQPTATEPYPYAPCGTSTDVSEAIAWVAADPTGNSLIEGLNTKMMHGTMSEAMKSKIRAAISFGVPADAKAKQAIYLVASSSQYQIQR